ncbi:related to 65 kDa virulence protein [Fusarium fujikuroi]|nr:related to 65 kDa virulence protein [Fusarium fujikuroi]
MERLDIAIIGAGWYGLAMGKTYLEASPDANMVIFDGAASIGGTWAKERLYPGLKTNNLLGKYEFSDFPMTPERFDAASLMMRHDAPHATGINGWSSSFLYEGKSLLSDDPSVKSKRLSTTSIGNKPEGRYGYAGYAVLAGCMTSIPKFSELHWNMEDMLGYSSTQNIRSGVAERTYYKYDRSGNRVRKVTESAAKIGEDPRNLKDTLFLESIELQTQIDGPDNWIANVIGIEVLAMIETSNHRLQPLVRFQTGTDMELDGEGLVVSYEEYSTFGNALYSFMYGQVEAPRKYRFAGYEHDRETGLYHCGLRYYCLWIACWTSPDPLGEIDGPNLYEYCKSDPINFVVDTGMSKILKSAWGYCRNHLSLAQIASFQYRSRKSPQEKKETSNRDSEQVRLFSHFYNSGYRTAQQNMKSAAKKKEDRGDQHHVYPQSYRHLHLAADIDPDAFTIRMVRSLHQVIGTAHDRLWSPYYAKVLGLEEKIKNKANLRQFEADLRDPDSDHAKKLTEIFQKDPEHWRNDMQRHAAYTCQEVGLCMEKIQDCVGYYGEKTETSTWDRYTGQASPSYLHDFDR